MPRPKLFGKFSSKSNNSSESSSVRDAPANDRRGGALQTVTVTSDGPVPGYSDSLKEAWTAAHQELPRAQGAEKFLNKIGGVQDSVMLSPGQQTVVDTLAAPAKALMDTPQIAESIHKGVNTFMETVPILMKALDEVAKVHPFISVVVLAFKAVYTLETKRLENDKRVLTLYAEMKDMMAVLVQLKDVTDAKQIAPGGQTIEGRMQELCEAVAKDIKKCANTCDTYLRRRVLVKIFAGPIWEGRLLEFVKIFTGRREEFQLALAIHTTAGVDAANLKLDTANEQTAELTRRVDIMLELFQEFVSPEQKKLAAMVEQMNGVAALDSEQSMEELADAELALVAPLGSDSRRGGGRPFDFVALQCEIRANPDEAIEKNCDLFDRKFDIQRRQIVEDIERTVNREGDRIILAVTAGPHDRIVDPDIYKIWKDMAWRGSVKARHFVMSLRDHYTEKNAGETGPIKGPDSWATEYINVGRARSILEAIDDDASGFVTVHEINNFTQRRPRDWSLPHSIAYWAIGWQMTCTAYCEKIEEIFDAMIRLTYEVLPENRKEVNEYVTMVWSVVTVFVQSIKREKGTEDLKSKFESYVAAEEAKLQRNLEDIKYDIDGYDTALLIAGEGRVETTLFPMLYLALKKDLEKISLAQKHVLSDYELLDAQETIRYIIDAAIHRVESLRGIFKQQDLEADDQFKVFAKGLYNLYNTHGAFFHGDKLRELPDPTPCRDEIIPNPECIPLSILNHPLGIRHGVDFAAYDPPELTLSPVEGGDPVLGVYYGFMYTNGEPTDPMIKLSLIKGDEGNAFTATGTHYRCGQFMDYKITGKWSPPSEDGKIPVELKIIYTSRANFELTGVFDPEENSLRGTMRIPACNVTGEFVFKRNPEFVRLYPAPSVISARKRWEFAMTAVLDRVLREAWSPAYFLKRIRDGKRYKDLSLRAYYGRTLDEDGVAEFLSIFPVLYEADARFYASLIRINLSKTPIFPGIRCDHCGSAPGGSRIICMDCHSETTTVDLCSELDCVNSTVTLEAPEGLKTHLPSHGMFKIHRIIFDRDMGRIEGTAKDALNSARGTLSELKEEGNPMPECTHCKTTISLPCWCCVDCTGEKLICDSCEYKQLAFDQTHTKMHTIVRVSEKVEANILSTDERLRLVEGELGKIRQLLAKLVVEKGTQPLPEGEAGTKENV